jgi:membrane protease YdiL (CAAX protease family)
VHGQPSRAHALASLLLTAVLAPLLEETVFRGFLLTSLTKFMPTSAAVLVSSLAFGLIHFAPRDFPQASFSAAPLQPCWMRGARRAVVPGRALAARAVLAVHGVPSFPARCS